LKLFITEVMCSGNYIKKYLMKKTMDNAKKVFSVSSFTRNKLIEYGIAAQKVVIVPNGVDTDKFRNVAMDSSIETKRRMGFEGRQIILTVATLFKRKSHKTIIQAIKEIKKTYPNILYLIVGDGPERENLARLIEAERLADNVLLLGFVSDEKLVQYYNICNVFILTSVNTENDKDIEGFGIVYIEANACGKPVIGGKIGGETDAIIDGQTGLLVDPHNISEITNAIMKLLGDKAFAKNIGDTGRKRVSSELTWENSTKKIVKELDKITQYQPSSL